MANEELVESLLRLKIDQSAVAGARQGIQSVKNDLADLGSSAADDIATTNQLAGRLADVNKQAAASKGNLRSLLGATGQIAGSIIPGAGQAFGVAGAVTEVKQQFGALKETIGGLSGGMKALGAAGIGLGVALSLAKQRFDEVKAATLADLDARQRALELLKTGTTEDIQARIKQLQTEKRLRQDAADDANRILDQGRKDIQKQLGPVGAALTEVGAALNVGAGELAAAKEKAAVANKALGETSTELDLLTQAGENAAPTQADLAASEKAAAEAAQKLTEKLFQFAEDSIDSQVATQQKITELMKNGSEEQLNSIIASTQAEIDATKQKIAAQYELAKQYENEPEIYNQISERITALQTHQTDLTKSLDALSNSMIRGYVVSNDAAKKMAETQTAIVDSYKSYQDDVLNITTKFNQDYANLEQKKADTVEKIQQDAVDSAAKLLEDLQQKQSDMRSELGRDLTDLANQQQQEQLQSQINFQREEVRAEKKTQDDIARIKRQAQQNEFELSLDRDFAGLARSRRATANQISEIGIQAQKDRQARLDAYREKAQDDNSAYVNERQQRITQYQRSLEDAQLNYQREYRLAVQNKNRQLAAAQASYNTELAQLNSNLRKQLDTRYQAAQSEISLARQTTDTRLKTFQTEYEAAIRFFNLVSNGVGGTTGSGSGGGVQKRAFGGSLNAFSRANVNEGSSSGNESFRSGGKSARFPSNTAGLFIPFSNGSVDKGNNQAMNITIPITIDAKGGDPAKIEAMLDTKLEGVVRRIFVNKAV